MSEKISGNILFIGDSITDDGRYISYINSYLNLYNQNNDIKIFNLGVSSETISGLSEEGHPFPRPCLFNRLNKILETVKPDWVISLYGINDAIYSPFSEENFLAFSKAYIELANIVKENQAKLIILTPVPFDQMSYKSTLSTVAPFGFQNTYMFYNNVMKKYSAWLKQFMPKYCDRVIDLYGEMAKDRELLYAQNLKATTGDGIHPDERGHFFMAKVILKEVFRVELCLDNKTFDKSFIKYYKNLYAKDKLVHSYYKEFVGHDNIYKDKILSKKVLNKKISKIDKKLKSISKKLLNRKKKWEGFLCDELFFEGYKARVVFPKVKISNKWVYRTEFFGAFAQADIAMLNKGYYLINLEIPNMYGGSYAVEIMKRFIMYITNKYQLSKKGILFGFSRGGLYALNYTAKYSSTVEALYLDAPVVDIKSWPFGQGKGHFAEKESKECLQNFNINSPTEYYNILTKAVRRIIEAKIPLIIVSGNKDLIVPYEENGFILEQEWKKNNIKFMLILKDECGHHPHSLDDPKPIVDFLTQC